MAPATARSPTKPLKGKSGSDRDPRTLDRSTQSSLRACSIRRTLPALGSGCNTAVSKCEVARAEVPPVAKRCAAPERTQHPLRAPRTSSPIAFERTSAADRCEHVAALARSREVGEDGEMPVLLAEQERSISTIWLLSLLRP